MFTVRDLPPDPAGYKSKTTTVTSDAFISFEDLADYIETAPGTWLPALLARVAEECMKKNIFKNRKAIISYIKNVIVKDQVSKGRDD